MDQAAADAAVALVTGAGGQAVAHVGAVGTSAVADALVDRAVSEFGRLDILVTNAGVLRDTVLWKMTDEQFDLVSGRPRARHVQLRPGRGDPVPRAG